MKNKILIVTGDPNSINSEIIYKCWKKINNSLKERIYFISNYNLINNQFKKLNYSIKIRKVNNINQKILSNDFKIINIDLKFTHPFNVPLKSSSKFIIESLDLAHKYGLRNNVIGIINCAIDKRLLNKKKIGVTEYLSSKCKIKNNSEAMLIRNNNLAVSPITTHIDVKDISKNIEIKTIVNKVKTIDLWYKKKLNKKPKIAVLGLNPHNAELRKNSEENKKIIPAILRLQKLKINLEGPLVADTIFINDYKKYDVIVGMYHDQVISPFKTLFKFDAINVTLGLKYLRVSPDHGIGANIIQKNRANEISLLNCINFINNFKC